MLTLDDNRVILLRWDGPFKLVCERDAWGAATEYRVPKLPILCDECCAYGVYQIVGAHPVYGARSLLYIGKADQRSFYQRLCEHDLGDWSGDPENLEIYVGHLKGEEVPDTDEWSRQINEAERLLIFSHAPAYNSQHIARCPDDLARVRVFNLHAYGLLLPDVSGARFDPEVLETIAKMRSYAAGD